MQLAIAAAHLGNGGADLDAVMGIAGDIDAGRVYIARRASAAS
jgi:hypothetical protein